MKKTSVSHSVHIVFDAHQRQLGGLGAKASRALAALAQISLAATVFYIVWWPVDAWLTTILCFKTPLVSRAQVSEAWDAVMSGEMIEAPPHAGRTSAAGSEASDEFPDTQPRWLYPSRQRAHIMISTFYGWEAFMVVGVCLCAYAGGTRLGSLLPASTRKVRWGLVILCLTGLMLWAAMTSFRWRGQFSVSAGQTGIGWLTGLAVLMGIAVGKGVAAATILSGLWSILAATASVLGLILWGRCDALEPAYQSSYFLAVVFFAVSAYGWLVLIWFLWNARNERRGFVRVGPLPAKRT